MGDVTSRPFRPDPARCCERCVFNTGDHAAWCPVNKNSAMLAMIEESAPFTEEDYAKLSRFTPRLPLIRVTP